MKKTITKILKIFSIIILLGASVLLGIYTGQQINNKHFNVNSFLSANINELSDDVTKIDYKNKTPDQLSSTDAYLVSIYILEDQENYKKTLNSDIKTNIGYNQTVEVINLKEGSKYIQEYCTRSSLIDLASRLTFEKNSTVEVREGTPSGPTLDSVTWSDNVKTYTYEEFGEILGRDPAAESSYLVSTKTLLSASDCIIENGIYTYTISLHPKLSTINYLSEIEYKSGLDKTTIDFTSLEVTFSMDKNFKLISSVYTEAYSFKYSGIPISLTAVHNVTFSY